MKKSYWFMFYNGSVALVKRGGGYYVPLASRAPLTPPKSSIVISTGQLNGVDCKAFAFSSQPHPKPTLPRGYELVDLRASHQLLTAKEFWAAGKAFQFTHWDTNSRYCPACGVATTRVSVNAKQCPTCKQEIYPRINPVVMVLVRKGSRILMVRGKNFRRKFYGLVAGFVEAGETLEECAHREVMEETNIKIKNLRYITSQPWPFPSNLIIGFFADYAGGKLRVDTNELETADFFDINNLPPLPSKISLARKLVQTWLKEQKEL
ncbi:NAD+ diphosphatase [Elusimicrobium simillimum]|uniref:NAD(+) diphosphatase n=1 Tax=Elusimicrobium simillimum TaxID=3143438 RepID=UPI003C6F175C